MPRSTTLPSSRAAASGFNSLSFAPCGHSASINSANAPIALSATSSIRRPARARSSCVVKRSARVAVTPVAAAPATGPLNTVATKPAKGGARCWNSASRMRTRSGRSAIVITCIRPHRQTIYEFTAQSQLIRNSPDGASGLPTTIARRALDDESGGDLGRHIAVTVFIGLIWRWVTLPNGRFTL